MRLLMDLLFPAIIEPLAQGKAARVFLRDDTLRSLIYTPDTSRAMALPGNTPDAYGQTWHLPCDDDRLTYRAFIERAAELLPRYETDNIFVSDRFKTRFPDFSVTTFREGLASIRDGQHHA